MCISHIYKTLLQYPTTRSSRCCGAVHIIIYDCSPPYGRSFIFGGDLLFYHEQQFAWLSTSTLCSATKLCGSTGNTTVNFNGANEARGGADRHHFWSLPWRPVSLTCRCYCSRCDAHMFLGTVIHFSLTPTMMLADESRPHHYKQAL